MVDHLLLSLAWLAGVLLALAILLWLAGVGLGWITAYRLAKWQRQNQTMLQELLRKRSL